MATTKRGIRYPYGEDYDLDADVPEDLKKMAESTDEAIDDVEESLEEKLGTYTNTYDSTETYLIGSIVVYDKKIYECLEETTGEFDTTKWQEISIKELIDIYKQQTDNNTSTIQELDETKADVDDVEELQNEIEKNYKEITKLQEENEDLKKNQLTNTPEIATSHYLQDSADARFRRFIPIGRTTQESTTGYNIFDAKAISGTKSSLTFSFLQDTGTNKISGDKYGSGIIKFIDNPITIPEAGDYSILTKYFSGNVTYANEEETAIPRVYLFNDADGSSSTGSIIGYCKKQNTEKTIQLNAGTYYIGFLIWRDHTIFNNYEIGIDIVSGSNVPSKFEKYTGGEPAPNPKYPFPIKNTGDNGSVNEKAQNENLLSTQNIDTTIAGVTYKSQDDGVILANGKKYGTSYVNLTNNVVTLENGTYSSRIFLLNGTIQKDGVNKRPSIYLTNQDDNTKSYNIGEIGNPGKSQTIEAGTYFIKISLWGDNIVFTNAKIGFMLVKGSTIPDEFIPHSEQNISFPLAEGQKFYEGSHPDDDEKVHHKMGEVVFDGSDDEGWDVYSQVYFRGGTTQNILKTTNSKCNIATVKALIDLSPTDVNKYAIGGSRFWFRCPQFETLAAWKAYLAEQYANGTPVRVVFELAEEQTEAFTEEQKTAWEEWKKARTYKNVTHISSEDETPANVEIEYVQDTKTYIDNQIEPLKSAIISLGGNV